jgi:hypothetical protein
MREIAELKIEANNVIHTIKVCQDGNQLEIHFITPGARADIIRYTIGTYKKQFIVKAASVLTNDIFQSLNSEITPPSPSEGSTDQIS